MEKVFKLILKEKEIECKFNNLAEQANGQIITRIGDTVLLTTVVMGEERPDFGFFPLTVEFEEKYYAAGKIKGARFIKREGKPSDEAICTARLIDRSIRPRFSADFTREVQVISAVFSWDNENDPDILGLIGSSLALSISDIPWQGPLAAVRVGRVNNEFILNPTYEQRKESDLDIVFAGALDQGNLLINMIEGGAKEVKEETIIQALDFAKEFLEKIIYFQQDIIKEIGKEKISLQKKEVNTEFEKIVKDFLKQKLENVLFEQKADKTRINDLKKELTLLIQENYPEYISLALQIMDKEIDYLIHKNILDQEKRVDQRKLDEIRPISCQVGLFPRTHGSGLFCRGKTKGLSILTLGAPGDQQLVEGMEVAGKKRFMHHYNFPPYSVGEAKPLRGPGRREIGHGLLAEKALEPLIPEFEVFPYTIRIVSEMISSNGSTSMASVSSSSLALMDAGVPIKRPAAGIAVGLIKKNNKEYKLLTDIQGPEDHHGDMDFKIAGTTQGITALQMDVKIDGITKEIIEKALERGKKAREEILAIIIKTLDKPRENLSVYAPRILTLQINPEKIREVIGPGGKVINEIIDQTGVEIDIEPSGLVFITSEKQEAAEQALKWVQNIVREVVVGEVFEGKVQRILDFGAFVEILPGQDGLIHISKLSNKRVNKVEDIVKVGDLVSVKVISIDEQGRINLSLLEKNNKQ
ncbi:MAG: polyribonucleotide nucleotidyltransferase [Candidatus Pacebacteria bacterium]|nr:polyribonucleotide nucleotidyltransferase [Candidatus Paceibacterota bacterium]